MLRKRGKIWWIDFITPNGQRIRRSTQTSNKTQAQEFHDKLKADLWRQVQLGDKPKYRWDDAGLRWLEEKSHKASLVTDEILLTWLQPHLGGKLLDSLNRDFLMSILDIKKKETTPSTANHYMAIIRSILRACVEWGWIDYAPVLKPYKTETLRIRWLTPEQAGKLLSLLPDHLADMVAFSLATGLRKSNVTGLEWSQVDENRRIAWIHPDQAKARKAIPVPLDDVALSIIQKQHGKNTRFVFTYRGNPVQQTNTKAWRKALAQIGLEDFRWHDLRHTWASWHIQSGTPLHVLQELGGWHSSAMVRRYAHLAAEHLEPYAHHAGQHLQKSEFVTNPSQRTKK